MWADLSAYLKPYRTITQSNFGLAERSVRRAGYARLPVKGMREALWHPCANKLQGWNLSDAPHEVCEEEADSLLQGNSSADCVDYLRTIEQVSLATVEDCTEAEMVAIRTLIIRLKAKSTSK